MDRRRWRCDCGDPLDLSPGPGFDPDRLEGTSLWRYRPTFDLPESGQRISLGEGGTPLIRLDPDRPNILAKLEYLMPTLSFKDRGAAVLVNLAVALGAKQLVADSSGNAGTAIAAYAARAGLPCHVFVPEATSPKKLAQLRAHGAVVHAAARREDAAAAAIAAVESSDAFYASHVWQPAFLEGTKTFAFEMWEQLGRRAPDEVFVPVGNGTLLLGTALGFAELKAADLIPTVPRLIAVQAAACNPLEEAWRNGAAIPEPADCRPTEAEGIAIAAPVRGRQILAAVRASDGRIVAVSEDAIANAQADLAARGLYVEPTAAAVYAGLLIDEPTDRVVVLPLCGAGLKGA